jgi:hypothetical protein
LAVDAQSGEHGWLERTPDRGTLVFEHQRRRLRQPRQDEPDGPQRRDGDHHIHEGHEPEHAVGREQRIDTRHA